MVKWCRRRPAVAALVAVSLVALGVVTGVLLDSRRRLEAERDIAQGEARARGSM